MHYTLSRLKKTGSTNSCKRSGRPSKYDRFTCRKIHRAALADPFASASDIRASLIDSGAVAPSVRRIQEILKDRFGLPSRRPAKKPKLSPKNIKDRLAFCRRHADWTQQQWRRVLFTDESSIEQFGTRKRHFRRPVSSCEKL